MQKAVEAITENGENNCHAEINDDVSTINESDSIETHKSGEIHTV